MMSRQRDALIVTPGSIKADMDTVRALVGQLDADINASNKASATFKQSWRRFVAEFEDWYQSTGYFGRWWSAAKEKTDEYRRRVTDWRTMAIAEGVKSSAPEDHPPGDNSISAGWKIAALTLAALGGAIGIAYAAASRPHVAHIESGGQRAELEQQRERRNEP